MASAGTVDSVDVPRNRVYTDAPYAAPSEPFKVRARLTKLELLALAAVIGVCVSMVGFEFGYRRPMRDAAIVAKASQEAERQASLRRSASKQSVQVPLPSAASGTERAKDSEVVREASPASGDSTRVGTASAVVAAAAAAARVAVRPAADVGVDRTRATPQDDPFQTPGTIYRCRTYADKVFWSAIHCSKQPGGALIERIARVPADQPFDAQVRIASRDAQKFESSLRAEQAEIQRMNTCAALVGEQAQILRRAGDATVLAAVQASDRTRAREIDATVQRLRCNG